jgi:cytochrome c-type biogenesis protein CcmH/NrfG
VDGCYRAILGFPSAAKFLRFFPVLLLFVPLLGAYVLSDPGDPEAHFFLGSALKATGKNDQARAELEAAARLDPKNPRNQSAVTH